MSGTEEQRGKYLDARTASIEEIAALFPEWDVREFRGDPPRQTYPPLDEAGKQEASSLKFLRRCAKGDYRIVSSVDLTEPQIAEAQVNRNFFVDEETGVGWALLPWRVLTRRDMDRQQEWMTEGKGGK